MKYTIEETPIGFVINWVSSDGTVSHSVTGFKTKKECEDHLKCKGERYYSNRDIEVAKLISQMNQIAKKVMILSMGKTTMTYDSGCISRESDYNLKQLAEFILNEDD